MSTGTAGRDGEAVPGLADGLRDRQPWAIEFVGTQVLPRVRPTVMRRLGDAHLVDDVLHDALLRAVEDLPRAVDDDGVVPWVTRVALNLAHDHHRQRARRPVLSLAVVAPDDELVVSMDEGPESRVLADSERAEINAVLAGLSPRDRAMLLARDLEGDSVEEIGTRFEMTRGSARVALHRIRAAVRAQLRARRVLGLGLVVVLWRRVRASLRHAPVATGAAAVATVVVAAVGVAALVTDPVSHSTGAATGAHGRDGAQVAPQDPHPDAPDPTGRDRARDAAQDPTLDAAAPVAVPGHGSSRPPVGDRTGVSGGTAPPTPSAAAPPSDEAPTEVGPPPAPEPSPSPTPAGPPPPSPEPEETPGPGVEVDLEVVRGPVVTVPVPVPCLDLGLPVVSTCPRG